MKYTQLGASDLQVSKICLGTMTWGAQNTQEEAFEQMDYALVCGVNFWDTAEMYAVPPAPDTYGTTEVIIGHWLQKTNKRKEVVLATKFSPVPWARHETAPKTNKQNLIQAVDASLQRLQTDYIDLYQLHWPTNRANYHFDNYWQFVPTAGDHAKTDITNNMQEIMQTAAELVQQGKIRFLGLSNDSAWGIAKYATLAQQHNLPPIVSVQNEYSLLRRRDEYDVAETCTLENIGYLPWSPLAMGVLSGKYLKGQFPAGSRFSKEVMKGQRDRFSSRIALNALPATSAYIEVANAHGLDACQMAIAFTLNQSWVTSTIIGATSMKQLATNIDAVNLVLTKQCLADIQQVYRKYPVPF